MQGIDGLEGKVALVTGAGRGLGRAEAIELARCGVRVVVNDYGRALTGEEEASPAEEVAAEIRASGGDAIADAGDVAAFDDARAMVQRGIDEWGRLDIVVNNAGFLRDRMIFNMDEADFDAVVRVHLKGHFCTSRWATAYWRDLAKATSEPVYGRVINTASEAGLTGSVGQPNYAAAKAGIMQLTLATAMAMARYGVTANAICPRARTRMTDGSAWMGEPGENDPWAPENVSPLVAYLASPAASNVSGQVFVAYGSKIDVIHAPGLEHRFEAPERWTPAAVDAALSPFYAGRAPVQQGFAMPLG